MVSGTIPGNFGEALSTARKVLASNEILNRKGVVVTEAEQIVAAAFKKCTAIELSRVELFARLADPIPSDVGHRVLEWADARAGGKLLQHVLGFQYFFKHEYRVAPGVLVPRPETEVLVDIAVTELRALGKSPALGLEIGLGSGVIAIELLAEFPSLSVVASELEKNAIEIARENVEHILPSTRWTSLKILSSGDFREVWRPFESVLCGRKADFLISNPPYLAPQDPIDDEVLRCEPHRALFSPEEDPVFFYRKIADHFRNFVREDGMLFFEIPPERAGEVEELFHRPELESLIIQDLNGRDRVLVVRMDGLSHG